MALIVPTSETLYPTPTFQPQQPVAAPAPEPVSTPEISAAPRTPHGQDGFAARFPANANIRALENQIARLERLTSSAPESPAPTDTIADQGEPAATLIEPGTQPAPATDEPGPAPLPAQPQPSPLVVSNLEEQVGLDLLRARLADLLARQSENQEEAATGVADILAEDDPRGIVTDLTL